MKKFFGILIFGFFCCNLAIAETIKKDYSMYSLNENITEYGWKIKSKEFVGGESPKEIYTLIKGEKILVCQIRYARSSIETVCEIP